MQLIEDIDLEEIAEAFKLKPAPKELNPFSKLVAHSDFHQDEYPHTDVHDDTPTPHYDRHADTPPEHGDLHTDNG